MGKNKYSDHSPPTLSYVVRRPFTFAGRKYRPGETFADLACDGERLERLKVARLIELAHVVAERSRQRSEPPPPARVVDNTRGN